MANDEHVNTWYTETCHQIDLLKSMIHYKTSTRFVMERSTDMTSHCKLWIAILNELFDNKMIWCELRMAWTQLPKDTLPTALPPSYTLYMPPHLSFSFIHDFFRSPDENNELKFRGILENNFK
jgi:hypothetical protein